MHRPHEQGGFAKCRIWAHPRLDHAVGVLGVRPLHVVQHGKLDVEDSGALWARVAITVPAARLRNRAAAKKPVARSRQRR